MLSDTSQQSMIQHILSDPPPDEVIIGRESPCIDRPFSTRAPHTYIELCVDISHGCSSSMETQQLNQSPMHIKKGI